MPPRRKVRFISPETDGDEADFASAESESINPEMSITTPDHMVDLIHQPAWKTILISLVKYERMDPWNIDIKILAQKYLEKIRALNSTDLRLPANAILASAILLKFKARALRLPSLEEDEVEWKSLLTEEQLLGGMMPELFAPALLREGKVSLDQLVESIEAILDKTKSKVQRERDGRERPAFNLPFASMNLESKMKEVFDAALACADSAGLARFAEMVQGQSVDNIIESFLALLFLVNDRKLNAWQETLFGEIFVSRVLTPPSVDSPQSEEAEA